MGKKAKFRASDDEWVPSPGGSDEENNVTMEIMMENVVRRSKPKRRKVPPPLPKLEPWNGQLTVDMSRDQKKAILKGRARAKNTLTWMLQYARRYQEANQIEWEPSWTSLIPPTIDNDSLENFILHVWDQNQSKAAVTQGKRYLNYILTTSGRPPMNKFHREQYATVLDMMKGLSKEKNWREHIVQGAKSLTLKQVRGILNASVLRPGRTQTFDYEALRNKSLAIVLLLRRHRSQNETKIQVN